MMAWMGPRFTHLKQPGKPLSREAALHGATQTIRTLVAKYGSQDAPDGLCHNDVTFSIGVPDRVRHRVATEFGVAFSGQRDAFVVEIDRRIQIHASSSRGLLHGAVTLLRLADQGQLGQGIVYDYPVAEIRAVKVHLPGREQIPFFKRLVDLLAFYRYSHIMLEVGGGMEYLRHPEINQGWERYCREIHAQPGTPSQFKNSFPWFKNSIHTEVGSGSFLTQGEVRELVTYCRDRELEVVPEVPTLSHSDYLLVNHPELAERAEDPYPDTYCPSHPAVHRLVQDVLDEVCAVFEPSMVNIGHDEWYSIALCDRCNGRDPAELYVGDVDRITAYLNARNVTTMIWADKLLDATDTNGDPCGGAEVPMREGKVADGKVLSVMPATHHAIDLVSPQTILCHWYWSLGRGLETEFHSRNLTYLLGNFHALRFTGGADRISMSRGVVVSHWSAMSEEYAQRTQAFLLNIVLTSSLAWASSQDDGQGGDRLRWGLQELWRYRRRPILERICTGTRCVEVLHTTDFRIEYQAFTDGARIDPTRYRIGSYQLTYEDGATSDIPIVYGQNISTNAVSWDHLRAPTGDHFEPDWLLVETSWSTLPVLIDGVTYYRHLIENPHPDKRIIRVHAQVPDDSDHTITVRELILH